MLWGGKYCSGENLFICSGEVNIALGKNITLLWGICSALGNMLWGIYSEEVNVALGENIALGKIYSSALGR